MGIIYVLIPVSIVLAIVGLVAFVLSVKSGQFDDLDTPAKKAVIPEDDEL